MLKERESRYRGKVSRQDYDNEDLPAGRMKQHHHPGRHSLPWRSNATVGRLHKNLGRPWDKVYAEWVADTPRPIDRQVLDDQLRAYLITNAYRCVDGRYRSEGHRGWGWRREGEYYVHPKTGVLCFQKQITQDELKAQHAARRMNAELMRRGLIGPDYKMESYLPSWSKKPYDRQVPIDNGFRPENWKQIDKDTFWEKKDGTWFIHTSIRHMKGEVTESYWVDLPDGTREERFRYRLADAWTNTKCTASKKNIRDILKVA